MRSSGTSLLGRTAALVLLLFALVGQAWAQTSPRFQIHNVSRYAMGYQVIYTSDVPELSGIEFESIIKLLPKHKSTQVFRSVEDYGGHVVAVKAGLVAFGPDGQYLYNGEVASAAVPAPSESIESFSLSSSSSSSGGSVQIIPDFGVPQELPDDTTVGHNPPRPLPLERHRFVLLNHGPGPVLYQAVFPDHSLSAIITIPEGQHGFYYGQVAGMYARPDAEGYTYPTFLATPAHLHTNEIPIFETNTAEHTPSGGPTGLIANFTDPLRVVDDDYTPASSIGSD